jgi:hypothetical protein
MSLPPWRQPLIYNDDRWAEPKQAENMAAHAASGQDDDPDVRDAGEVEEMLRRPASDGDRTYECNDTTPVDYTRGPHDEEFGVEEKEFDSTDDAPLDYENGPHDQEFGDDEDYEPAEDDEPFEEV